MVVCIDCHCDPCLLSLHKEALAGELSILDSSLSSSKKQIHLYRCFVCIEYGILGPRHCVHIPICRVEYFSLSVLVKMGIILGTERQVKMPRRYKRRIYAMGMFKKIP